MLFLTSIGSRSPHVRSLNRGHDLTTRDREIVVTILQPEIVRSWSRSHNRRSWDRRIFTILSRSSSLRSWSRSYNPRSWDRRHDLTTGDRETVKNHLRSWSSRSWHVKIKHIGGAPLLDLHKKNDSTMKIYQTIYFHGFHTSIASLLMLILVLFMVSLKNLWVFVSSL